jgi:hypothetical protein
VKVFLMSSKEQICCSNSDLNSGPLSDSSILGAPCLGSSSMHSSVATCLLGSMACGGEGFNPSCEIVSEHHNVFVTCSGLCEGSTNINSHNLKGGSGCNPDHRQLGERGSFMLLAVRAGCNVVFDVSIHALPVESVSGPVICFVKAQVSTSDRIMAALHCKMSEGGRDNKLTEGWPGRASGRLPLMM